MAWLADWILGWATLMIVGLVLIWIFRIGCRVDGLI